MTISDSGEMYLLGWQHGLEYARARLQCLPDRTPTENATIDRLDNLIREIGQMIYWRGRSE